MSDSATGRDGVFELTRILFIDEDPIFKLGLRTALEAVPELRIVAEADTSTQALEFLNATAPEETVDLVILDLGIGRSDIRQLSGLALCQQLKSDYSELPVLLLTAVSEPNLLATAKGLGVQGYCSKGCEIELVIQAIREIIAGGTSWQTLSVSPLTTSAISLSSTVRPPSWHNKMRLSGMGQIEDTLAQVTQQLENPNLSNWDWLFWCGRRRELLAARWVVNQILPTDVVVLSEESGVSSPSASAELPPARNQPSRRKEPAAVVATSSQLSATPRQTTPFEVTVAKLQSGVQNLTGVLLEIDILQTEKRRDLLYIVLRKFEDILEELRFSQVTVEQLNQKRSLILNDLWQVSIVDFFGKYYTLTVDNNEIELVNILLKDIATVQNSILEKIPFVVELLSHSLFETPLIIDNVSYPAQTPEALARSEILLQNLVIQVANAVIQPLLNNFADLEIIKQNFYDRRLISSREIARFRNNLSGKYRLSRFIDEPRSIFESRYELLVLSGTGIKKTSVYAPRRRELEQLQGIRLAVTLAYEARDATSPVLRTTVAWAGRGVVYFLTQVIGRAIGLVVRGIIQGIGSSLQEVRFGKNSERGK
ncbi:DUF3685 domain-containing protein [Lyngbya aestuarii]|uniref:DUF3685 domain-containing protein n=1 Tax=Lyngbya aestuarii TaxID=118322 RepID=UPI00403D5E66